MREKYIGEKCPVCGEAFSNKDDIVVCPDCGTPYHRPCWQQEGSCLNRELHDSGESWQPAPKEPEQSALPIRCVRCGADNPAGTHFCGQCGLPLVTPDDGAPRPFNAQPYQQQGFTEYRQPDSMQGTGTGSDIPPFGMMGAPMPGQTIKLTAQSDIDGIKLGDFMEYTGRSSFAMLASFIKFAATKGKLSFNLGAFFFPEFYMFYRKMNKKGVLMLTLSFLLSLPSLLYYGQNGSMGMVLFNTDIDLKSNGFVILTNICSLISMILSVVCGFYANYWYYTKAKHEISEIRSEDALDDNEAVSKIRSKGGTSIAGVVGAFVAEMLLSLLFCLILSLAF